MRLIIYLPPCFTESTPPWRRKGSLLLGPCQVPTSTSLTTSLSPVTVSISIILRPSETPFCEKYTNHVEQQAGSMKMLITAWKNDLRLILNWTLDSIWVWYNLSSLWQWFQYAAICRIPLFSLKTSCCLDNIVSGNPGGEPYVAINVLWLPRSLPTLIFLASQEMTVALNDFLQRYAGFEFN